MVHHWPCKWRSPWWWRCAGGPTTPSFRPFLAYRNHLHPALHRVQDAVGQAPQSPWSVLRMAEVAHTSPRHLTRLFIEHAEIAPLQYLRRAWHQFGMEGTPAGQG